MCVITCPNVFNVCPKTTLLLPVWPRDTKRLDSLGPSASLELWPFPYWSYQPPFRLSLPTIHHRTETEWSVWISHPFLVLPGWLKYQDGAQGHHELSTRCLASCASAPAKQSLQNFPEVIFCLYIFPQIISSVRMFFQSIVLQSQTVLLPFEKSSGMLSEETMLPNLLRWLSATAVSTVNLLPFPPHPYYYTANILNEIMFDSVLHP